MDHLEKLRSDINTTYGTFVTLLRPGTKEETVPKYKEEVAPEFNDASVFIPDDESATDCDLFE